MRRRVLLPLLLAGIVVVLAILVPASHGVAHTRTQQLQLQREEMVNQMVQHASLAIEREDATALRQYLDRFYDVHGEAALIVDGSGVVIAAVGGLALNSSTEPIVTSALRGVPQRVLPTVYPWSGATAYAAEPVSSSVVETGAVLLRIDQSAAKQDVTVWWLLLSAAAVAVLALLLAASVFWTRWVLRPVLALDTATNRLAESQRFEPTEISGPPELQRLSHSFERMAHRVEDALEQQRGLVADASHQLRTPLAAIRLRIDALPDAQHSPEIDAVQRDLDRLEYTVDRMLALAHAEHRANENDGSAAPGDASPLIATSAATLVATHRHLLSGAGIALRTGDIEVEIRCEPDDLEEIVEILLDNARKYVPQGALVHVSFEQRKESVALVVSDSGDGLSSEDLALVGTRFWRSERHRDHEGSGLGYAIIFELARANGAVVDLAASPEGGLLTRVEFSAS